jgi:hypothetical protein
MLTIQDCIELSELTEEEILAIARHQHIPEMAALELGNYLIQTASSTTWSITPPHATARRRPRTSAGSGMQSPVSVRE